MAEAAAAIDNRQTAIFELQVKNLRDHVDVHERMNETKFDKIEALMAKNFFEQEAIINELRSEFKNMDARMSRMEGDINGLKDNIDNIKDDITDLKVEITGVKGNIEAIHASFNTLQNKFAWNLAWVGIIMALALALAQHFGK